MAYEMKDMTGSLFRNEKATSDNHPTHTGKVMIDGVQYYQSAWVKETNDGRKFFSQAFRRVEQDTPKAAPKKQAAMMGDDLSDVPFADPYKGRKAYAI